MISMWKTKNVNKHTRDFKTTIWKLHEDLCQTEKELEMQLYITQKCILQQLHQMEGVWLPHELTEKDVESRKSFLHQIVTNNVGPLKPEHNIHGNKIMLWYIMSYWNHIRLLLVSFIDNKSFKWLHVVKPVKETLRHPLHSTEISKSDYHVFRSIYSAFLERGLILIRKS